VLSGADALKMVRFVAFGGYDPAPRLITHRGPLLVAAAVATLVIGVTSYRGGIRSAGIEANNRPGSAFGEIDSMPVRQSATEQKSASSPSFAAPYQDAGIANQPAKLPPPAGVGRTAGSRPSTVIFGELDTTPARRGAAEKKAGVATPSASDSAAGGAEPSKASGSSMQGKSAGAPGLKRGPVSNAPAPPRGMVRIGRFTSSEEARKAWSSLFNPWPDVRSLPVVPVPIKSLRDGKTYYRMQVITTSRSHSDSLCKRAHDLDQSCTVIGAEEYGAEGPL